MTHLFEASCLQKVLESFQRAPESQSPFHPARICKEARQYRCEFARLQGTSSLNSAFAFLRTDWKVLHAVLTLTN